jgi:8-oxo-dGTP pyrophosphatase MutT (NUDIX family)
MNPESVVPVEAATVILVRPDESGEASWQCFMVRRHIRSDFAADVFVFPGGKVDLSDSTQPPEKHREQLQEVKLPPGINSLDAWTSLEFAAIRELFEEAGVLLARDASGSMVRMIGDSARKFEEYRRELNAREITLGEILTREELQAAASHLHPFSRWITPEPLPRRYDTWFFVAEMPDSQAPLHDAHETTDSTWISPTAALKGYLSGTFPLVFATEKQLERMSRYPTIDSLVEGISAADLEPVLPKIVGPEAQMTFLLPGDEGY